MDKPSSTVSEHCECTLSNEIAAIETRGICPLPEQSVMTKYVDSLLKVLQNSECHTLDRRNLRAQVDCGAGRAGSGYESKWREAVEREFNISNWAQVQSQKTATCLKQVFASSLESMVMSTGAVVRAGAGLLLIMSMIF